MAEFSGFYKLPLEERVKRVQQHAGLSESEAALLKNSGALGLDVADRMVENAIGATHLPLGLAPNFRINRKDYLIPMAIEEPSVIAAASNAAKLSLPEGFSAEADAPVMVGQVQLVGIKDAKKAIEQANRRKSELESEARRLTKSMEERGGGFRGLDAKAFSTGRGEMVVFYFDVDVRDSMGANTINTLLEAMAPMLAEFCGGRPRLRILSNLATKRMVRAKATWKAGSIGQDALEGILDAYELARADVYRAVTHNKGIMNGIDAVALATGNDWRAVESGAHAYASLSGSYLPLTHYEKDKNGDLAGSIELPLALGTVGGSISSNPVAKTALKIIGAKDSRELACVAACVGLANNMAALRVLSTVGIQEGHMKLHARNLAIAAGASAEEADSVAALLAKEGVYKSERAKEILKSLRSRKSDGQ